MIFQTQYSFPNPEADYYYWKMYWY